MKKVNIKNIKNAVISSILGLFILAFGTIAGSIAEGQFSWKSFLTSLAPSIFLLLTDILKEVKRQVDLPE